jgi:hypothetical protein
VRVRVRVGRRVERARARTAARPGRPAGAPREGWGVVGWGVPRWMRPLQPPSSSAPSLPAHSPRPSCSASSSNCNGLMPLWCVRVWMRAGAWGGWCACRGAVKCGRGDEPELCVPVPCLSTHLPHPSRVPPPPLPRPRPPSLATRKHAHDIHARALVFDGCPLGTGRHTHTHHGWGVGCNAQVFLPSLLGQKTQGRTCGQGGLPPSAPRPTGCPSQRVHAMAAETSYSGDFEDELGLSASLRGVGGGGGGGDGSVSARGRRGASPLGKGATSSRGAASALDRPRSRSPKLMEASIRSGSRGGGARSPTLGDTMVSVVSRTPLDFTGPIKPHPFKYGGFHGGDRAPPPSFVCGGPVLQCAPCHGCTAVCVRRGWV